MFVAHLTWKLLRLLEYSKLSSHNIREIKLKSKVSIQLSPLPITRELAPSNHILRKVLAQRNLLQVGPLGSLWTTRLVAFWKKKCNLWEHDEILGRSHHWAEPAERSFIRLRTQTLQLSIFPSWVNQSKQSTSFNECDIRSIPTCNLPVDTRGRKIIQILQWISMSA